MQASERVEMHIWKRKMRNGENERSVFRAIFRALKYVNFRFCTIKSKRIGTIVTYYKCTLFRAVYICNAHFVGWVSDVLERSRAERSRSDERSKERENDGLPK